MDAQEFEPPKRMATLAKTLTCQKAQGGLTPEPQGMALKNIATLHGHRIFCGFRSHDGVPRFASSIYRWIFPWESNIQLLGAFPFMANSHFRCPMKWTFLNRKSMFRQMMDLEVHEGRSRWDCHLVLWPLQGS